jgi:hypothetical protein
VIGRLRAFAPFSRPAGPHGKPRKHPTHIWGLRVRFSPAAAGAWIFERIDRFTASLLCLTGADAISMVWRYEVGTTGATGNRPPPFGRTGVAALFAALCWFRSAAWRVIWSDSFWILNVLS